MPTAHDRWKNRRRMAWAGLVAGLAYPLLLWVTDSDQIGSVAGPFYVFVTGIVASYYGWATWDDVKHNQDGEAADWPRAKGDEK